MKAIIQYSKHLEQKEPGLHEVRLVGIEGEWCVVQLTIYFFWKFLYENYWRVGDSLSLSGLFMYFMDVVERFVSIWWKVGGGGVGEETGSNKS